MWRPFSCVLLLVTTSVCITASPLDQDATPTILAKRATCTPASAGNAGTDDSPAIISAIQSCGNGGTIVFPAGKQWAIRSPVTFSGCAGCTLQIEGTLKMSNDVNYWNGVTAAFHISGVVGLTIYSSSGTGLVDGNGQPYWDAFAANSAYDRPSLTYIDRSSTDVTIRDLRFKNPPNVFHSVKGRSSRITFSGLTMTAAQADSSGAVPKNTDGFNIGASTYVTVKDTTVSNQDDCIAFQAGCNYVTVSNITCRGSHGLSVGSLGKSAGSTDLVQNVVVNGANMVDSTKAVGIKLYQGGSSHGVATVRNVTYNNINIDNCGYAAQIQSCYGSDDAASCAASPSTSSITDVHFNEFTGKTSGKTITSLNCPSAGTCNIYFSNFKTTAGSGTAQYLCSNIDNKDYGLSCTGAASG